MHHYFLLCYYLLFSCRYLANIHLSYSSYLLLYSYILYRFQVSTILITEISSNIPRNLHHTLFLIVLNLLKLFHPFYAFIPYMCYFCYYLSAYMARDMVNFHFIFHFSCIKVIIRLSSNYSPCS